MSVMDGFQKDGKAWLVAKGCKVNPDDWVVEEALVKKVGRRYVTAKGLRFRESEVSERATGGLVEYENCDRGENHSLLLFPTKDAAEAYVESERIRLWAIGFPFQDLPTEALRQIRAICDQYMQG